MIRHRRTRILATVGPASLGRLDALARAGADVFRLNFSHGTHDDHGRAAAEARAAEIAIERPIGLLADLQGPKFRIGAFARGEIRLRRGGRLRLDLDSTAGDEHRIALPHPEFLESLCKGARLALDDGKVMLEVVQAGEGFVETRVTAGERLSDHKGVAAPGVRIAAPALTAKDRADLEFALRLGVDWIALSFVQSAADMAELRRLVEGRALIMAKIEKPAAVDDLEAILDASDGLMVARGDLGVEIAPQDVPVLQKIIIRAARRRGAPVVVATQMLDSMTERLSPTRAEASDVAGAVYEGADALMLSAESAAGAYPVESVAMMDAIIARAEADPSWPSLMQAEQGPEADEDVDALIAAATRAAQSRSTDCLVAYTTTGVTARRMARERPVHPVLAIAPDMAVARRLALVWGLEPRTASQPRGVAAMTDEAAHLAAELGLAQPGARVIIIAGPPLGNPGAANLIRLTHAPRTRARG